MSKRRKKKLRIGFKVLFIFFLLTIIGFGIRNNFNPTKADTSVDIVNKNSNKENKPKPEEPKEEVYKISLFATGDGLIHNSLAAFAKQSDGSYNFNKYLTEIKEITKNYDIVYYNQETPFGTNESEYSYYPNFSVPREYGDAMIDAGFNLVSLASNHSYDKGEKGVLRSLEYWKTKDGIIYNGIASSEEERNNYQIGTKNNITYAMLSYTYGLNAESRVNELKRNNKEYLVNVFDKEKAKKDIEALRDKVDILIVAMHWGVEYQLNPNNTQKEQAKFLADLGVDIIIGNHPHCIQPIEWIDDTLVIYSLGNFISNQGILSLGTYGYGGIVKGTIGAYVTLDITKTIKVDKTEEITKNNLKVDLLYTYKNSKQKTYQVLPFSKFSPEYFKNYPKADSNYSYPTDYHSIYNSYSSVIKKLDSNIDVLPVAD